MTSDQRALHRHGKSSGDVAGASVSAQTQRGQAPSRHPLTPSPSQHPELNPQPWGSSPAPPSSPPLSSQTAGTANSCQRLPGPARPSALPPRQRLNVLTQPTLATPEDSSIGCWTVRGWWVWPGPSGLFEAAGQGKGQSPDGHCLWKQALGHFQGTVPWLLTPTCNRSEPGTEEPEKSWESLVRAEAPSQGLEGRGGRPPRCRAQQGCHRGNAGLSTDSTGPCSRRRSPSSGVRSPTAPWAPAAGSVGRAQRRAIEPAVSLRHSG